MSNSYQAISFDEGGDATGLYLREKRAQAELYDADKLRTAAGHCTVCGAKLHQGKCWYGCTNPAALASQREVDAAIIAAYEPKTQQYDSEPACGNYTQDEVDDMRHPTW